MKKQLTISALLVFVVHQQISAQGLPTDSIFAPNSFWYTPIPATVTLHTNTANFVAEFLRQKAAYYTTVNVNTYNYCSPVFIATASTPKVKVTWWDCQNKGGSVDPGLAQQWNSVPVRSQWEACWGGGMQNANTVQGIWPNPYGTTATGLPFLGGQVTAEELQRGEIRHAIGIALVDLANYTIVSWPATRSDGSNPTNATNRIAEGQRFRLDPTINVDLLNMHPVGKIIAKAAQKYGFAVWDKAGSISIRAQNASSYTALGQTDPYIALYNSTPEYALLNNFPWDKLQFLPMDYGKNGTPACAFQIIPALIEAENYCSMTGVQTETTTDAGGGSNIGYIDQNDYMDYPVSVATAGSYTVNYRVASMVTGAQFQLKNGTTVLNTITVPNTGGWQNWQTTTATVSLAAGQQTLRIASTQTASWNINWFEVKSITTGMAGAEGEQLSSIYPNPANAYFTLMISSEIVLKNTFLKIIDVCGKEVMLIPVTDNETIINRGDFQSGLYFYNIINNNESIAKGKLVIQ
jgi:hypothetical protein